MKKTFILLPLMLLAACQEEKAIYENDSYSLYTDRVVQGEYTGVAESPYRIVSNLDGENWVWEKKNDLSGFPKLITPYLVEEAVYNIGVDECINAVEEDETLRTGLEWGGVWTRDVSYSTILSMAYMQPKAAMTSLLCKINSKGEIIRIQVQAEHGHAVQTAKSGLEQHGSSTRLPVTDSGLRQSTLSRRSRLR